MASDGMEPAPEEMATATLTGIITFDSPPLAGSAGQRRGTLATHGYRDIVEANRIDLSDGVEQAECSEPIEACPVWTLLN